MEGWKVTKLGDLVEIQNGGAFKSAEFSETEGLPLIRIRDLDPGTETSVRYRGDFDPKYIVNSGDLLIGMDGEFRCYEWKGPLSLLNQRVCRIEQFSEDLSPRFLLYGINKYLKEIEDVTSFTTVKHLSAKSIRSIQFPLPPLPTQHRIVSILDEAFAAIDRAIANVERNVENIVLFEQAIIDQTMDLAEIEFGSKQISEIADVRGGKRLPKGEKTTPTPTGYPYISVKDFSDSGTIDTTNVRFISFDTFRKISRYTISIDDVYISIAGTIGRSGIIPSSLDGANLTENACRLILSPSIMNRFVYWATRSSRFQRDMHKSTRTTAQPKLALSRLKMIHVPVPPVEIQKEIAKRLETVSGETSAFRRNCNKKLESLQVLRQTLLHHAFTGRLTSDENVIERELEEAGV